MEPSRLAVLACPRCRGPLHAAATGPEGELACAQQHRFPVRGGIPRFVPPENYAASFGWQWKRFAHVQLDSRNGTTSSADRFRDITGWTEADLRGRRVLDAGCGAGRFAEVVHRTLGAELSAFDLSEAVEVCRDNLSPDPPLVVQASIYEPPFADGAFDFVYCIGVIQHTPDPARAVRSLARLVRPGGRIGLWIYEADWKSWVGTLGFRRLLRPIVSRWPRPRQLAFAEALTRAFFPLVRALRPLGWPGRALIRMTPVAAAHVVHLPLSTEDLRHWVLLDTFDMYSPAYDQSQTFEGVSRLLREEGFVDVERHPHGAIAVTARREG